MASVAAESAQSAVGLPQERPWRLLPLLALSIVVHLLLALGIAAVLSRHLPSPGTEKLDLGIDVLLGESVQELIVAQSETETLPTSPVPQEPAPPAPLLEPPPVPPEPAQIPELVEPAPPALAPPALLNVPENERAKATPAPKKKKPPRRGRKGPDPRDGIAGGNVTSGAVSGTPGGERIGAQGWRTPKPPYPRQALISRIEGRGEVRISTDAAGNVRDVIITRPTSAILDANTRRFARENWKGPPSSTRDVPVIYQIQR